jgi:hypothetical protein
LEQWAGENLWAAHFLVIVFLMGVFFSEGVIFYSLFSTLHGSEKLDLTLHVIEFSLFSKLLGFFLVLLLFIYLSTYFAVYDPLNN